MEELGSKLGKPAIKTRAIPTRTGLPTSVYAAMVTVICPLPVQTRTPGVDDSRAGKRNRFALCPRSSKDVKHSAKSSLFSVYICPEHTETFVTTCVNSDF